MAKRIRSPRFPQLALPANLRAWLNSPGEQALRERMRRLRDLPQERALREQLRQLRDLLETPPAKAPKHKRRKGGGRKRALSVDTITRLRAVYQKALRSRPKLAMTSLAYKFLRKRLPQAERDVSDRTLYRHIIYPVRSGQNNAALNLSKTK
jgi:hypothetical protein